MGFGLDRPVRKTLGYHKAYYLVGTLVIYICMMGQVPIYLFILGKEQNKAEEKVQLACLLKVKEMGPFGYWSKRFCVLCGARLHIFSSSHPKGKPNTTLNLPGGEIKEVEHKKYLYCVQVVTDKKTVLLSFDTRYDQSIWLKRAAKVRLHLVYTQSHGPQAGP